jgi:Icc-related predicted phosphoesterase
MQMQGTEGGFILGAEPRGLRALLVSDSHVNGAQLNRLAQWLAESKCEYDVVIACGNMANLVNKKRTEPSTEYRATEQLVDTLTFLLEHVKKPVIYVPGNTDPSQTFTHGIEMPHVINAHKRAVQLDDTLVLLGLGGSIPVQKDQKDILEGYPYQKDEDLGKDLTACFETADKSFGPEMSYIVLTHLGPSDSTTTDVYLGKEKVNAGSRALADALKAHSSQVLCNIHGHSAVSEGMTKPCASTMQVINPGGVTCGRFGELNLAKLPTGKWQVVGVKFFNLDQPF